MGRAEKLPPRFRADGGLRVFPLSGGLSRTPTGAVASVSDRLDAVMAAAEAKRLAMPHVVHVLDRATGLASVFGPFDDPLAASVFADRFVSDLKDVVPLGFVVTVSSLEPAE
jgi:hypothetical protein